ncbi:hypothetical protein CHS0354_003676 [Potamilus streckersoni]|uniref:Uncharacterized protein n=1 Tax=Potamilus streckersoni TaxID=2493646 RepID=A0AAE0W1U4_9BIVA|nr:hypothetical protein CHS0354_003676 [Potamilus streckersoni]
MNMSWPDGLHVSPRHIKVSTYLYAISRSPRIPTPYQGLHLSLRHIKVSTYPYAISRSPRIPTPYQGLHVSLSHIKVPTYPYAISRSPRIPTPYQVQSHDQLVTKHLLKLTVVRVNFSIPLEMEIV